MFHSRVSLVRKPVLRKATDTCIQNLIYNVFFRNVRIHSSSWCGHILLHSKHVHRDGQVTSLKDGLVFLDLHYRRRCVRFISLYTPHAGYSGGICEMFMICYTLFWVKRGVYTTKSSWEKTSTPNCMWDTEAIFLMNLHACGGCK